MITTAFKIDLIDPAIGMKEFTTQRRTPITISDRTICSNGMTTHLLDNFEDHLANSDVLLSAIAQVHLCTDSLNGLGQPSFTRCLGMTSIVIALLALLFLGAFFVMFLGGV